MKLIIAILCLASFNYGVCNDVKFDFLGNEIKIENTELLLDSQSYKGGLINKNAIDGLILEIEYIEDFFKQFETYYERLCLDGFGKAFILRKSANLLFADENVKKVFIWYGLNLSNYYVIMNYNEKNIFLYGYSKEKFYYTKYIELEGKKFTDILFEQNQDSSTKYLYVDDIHRKDDEVKLFSLESSPCLDLRDTIMDFSFSFNNKNYQLHLEVNKNYLNYIDRFPNHEFSKYHITYAISEPFKTSVQNEFRRVFNLSDTIETLNGVLAFTQQLSYKKDNVFFEYAFNPEQTIFYGNSDCEDKTILFAYIVTQLYGFKMLIIHYPENEHVNIGICMKGSTINSYEYHNITYKDETFVICEPTGHGFSFGEQANIVKDAKKTELFPLFKK